MSTKHQTYACGHCGDPFLARPSDRRRGWARFCSKSCAATKREKDNGHQFRNKFSGTGESTNAHQFSNEEHDFAKDLNESQLR